MKCPTCSTEVQVEEQSDRVAICPSCGSPLAPNMAVRYNPDVMAGAVGSGMAAGSSRRGGAAVLWIVLLIVVAIVVAFVLLHH